MKQLSALGVRRQFYRNPRRLRALRPGEELDGADLLGQHGFNYFVGQLSTHLSRLHVRPLEQCSNYQFLSKSIQEVPHIHGWLCVISEVLRKSDGGDSRIHFSNSVLFI